MSNGRVIKFNYLLYIKSEDHSIHNYSDINSQVDKIKLKKNIKGKIGNYLSRKLSSIGNLYLISEQTDNINTNKGILIGKSGGRTGTGDNEYIFMYDLSLITILDGDKTNSLDTLYNKVKNHINDYRFKFDMTQFNMLNGQLTYDFYISTENPKGIYTNNKFSTYSDEELTSTIPHDVYNEENVIDEIARTGNISDPFSDVDDSREDPSKVLENYDIDSQIESYKNDYNSKTTEIRKPKKSEIETIIQKVTKRLKSMVESEGYIYIENTPDFWDKVECSNPNCTNDQCDIYNFHEKKIQKVLKKQMKQGFGLTDDPNSKREAISSEMSNFYLDKDGNVYFRPEEIISWIIDYIHYVDPLCSACHKNVGGNPKHTKSIEESELVRIAKEHSNYYEKVNNKIDKNTENEPNEDVPDIKQNVEKLSINTDEDISESEWEIYRTPKESECEDIIKRVLRHFYKLGTRGVDGQINHIYKTVMKRRSASQNTEIDILGCDSCGKNLDIDEIEKHHPFPIKLREVHMDIINTVHMDPEESPIIVCDSRNEFIFSHKFLWRLESHLNNFNTSALTCSDCDSKPDNSDSKPEFVQETITKDNESNENKSSIDRNNIIDRIQSNTIINKDMKQNSEYVCAMCINNNYNENHKYQIVNQRFHSIKNNKRILVFDAGEIGVRLEKFNSGFIGFCPKHMESLIEAVMSGNPKDKSEVINEVNEYIQILLSES